MRNAVMCLFSLALVVALSGCGGGTMEVKTTPNSSGPTVIVEKSNPTVIVEKPSPTIVVQKPSPTIVIDKSGPSTETTRSKTTAPDGSTTRTETKTTTP